MELTKEATISAISDIFNAVTGIVPEEYRLPVSLIIFTVLIFLYALFVLEFYRFLAKRDILDLNLKQYNVYMDSGWRKFLAVLYFLGEFLVIIPLFVFFWFASLALFMLLLSKGRSIESILLISAAVAGATRISSYYSEKLSEDLAKMIPFTMLGIFLFDPNFFSFIDIIERLFEMPTLLKNIFMYVLSLFLLEFALRMIYTVIDAFKYDSKKEG